MDQQGHPERGYVWGNRLIDVQLACDFFTNFEFLIDVVANTIASTRELVQESGFEALPGFVAR